MIQVTYAGWLSGLDAMNAAGLVNGHNSVGCRFDRTGVRIDIRLWAYRLMRTCDSTGQFVAQIDAVPLTGKGFSIVLVDAGGDTCALEAAVPLVARRGRGAPFAYATNHYVTDQLKDADRRTPEAKQISICRFGYLRWIEQVGTPRGASDIQAILRSHEPWAPCRHGGPHGSHTLWSIVGLPRARKLLVADGPHCTHPYREFAL
jgi:hypothetical protein